MLRRWKEEEESRTLLTRMGLKFLYGLSVYIGPWVLRFPINVPPFFYILAGFGMVVKIILHYDNVALVIDCSHMVIHVIVGLQTYHIAKNKHKVLRLASFLDCFTRYSDQTSKGGEIKNECESHVLTLYAIFSRCILVTINIYILFPVYKLFTADGRANLSKVLVWPMWMGVPETSWWGFSILFTIELVTSMFLLLSVMYTVPYLASVGKMAAGQCELLCHSIRSMEMRVKEVTDNPQMQITFEQALNYELDEASRRLQLLKRASEDLAGIFKYYLSSFYYGGALALCMSGILAVADNEDKENSLKFLGILTGELVAISLATYVSEGIKTGFADIATTLYDTPWYNYPPKSRKRLHLMITSCPSKGLRTALGFELTLFHLADMLNASYKYYNLLLLTIKE